ncbi:MAG: peptide deformylase [Pseudomonadota bacterium]
MSVLPLCTAPHPCLVTPTQKVTNIDKEILKLLDDMLDTMHENDGIGLAANQVGISKRLAVIDLGDEPSHTNHPRPLKLINPQLIWAAKEKVPLEQGCLSVPEHCCEVIRPKEVKVKYTNEKGSEQEIHGTGLMAHCLQHEIDHLEGKLIIDYLSQLKKKMALRRLSKLRKQSELS